MQAELESAIAALESQRATLGDAVVEMATAPLRAKLAGLQRTAGLQQRQVTVLFADTVGSTAMAQGLDPEDTLAVLGTALKGMADIVHAHQGRVLRFTGDGVKAVFGMDAAHEDDAEHAVRAGLAILAAGRLQAGQAQQLHGIADLAFRVGVHTGSVVLGAGVEADNTAVGAAVNIAARMEQSAAPGTLRISHDTWSLVRGLFDMELQPPLQVKGVDAPMQTYLVRAALDRSTASVERGVQGLATTLVGRDAELQRLLQAATQARQTRQLQTLTLLGDAGLGKSRLLRELSATLGGGPGRCRVITLRSQPDGLLRPWGLLRSLLATQFGVADTDSADVARRKVVEGLSPCFAERGEQQAQLIGQLSGLDFGDSPHLRGLDPRSLRDQAFNALRAYLQALARDGALPVLLVEDLQWADDGSLDLLQHLMSHAAELPLVVLMTARPALLARRPDWGTAETTVQLSPLAAAQSDELAQALLQRMDQVPQKLTELIVGRGEGNPYYMEELLRRLVDDGVITVGEPRWTVQLDRLDTVRLPSTLVGLLQARLDALPAGVRQAARQASIIGHVFWDEALKALDNQAPQALPALQRAAFVRDHDRSDIEGTPERQFDHHLLHQVTYETLLKAERKLGHGAAARWLQQRTQGRGAEFLAMTGEHAERAGETALAIDCFEQAGKEAEVRFANSAAVSWTRRALTLLGEEEPWRRYELLRKISNLADIMGDRAGQDAVLAEVDALLQRHPDDERRAKLLFTKALLADRRSDTAGSERLCLQALELAERCGAAAVASRSHALLAWFQILRQEPALAVSRLEMALQWARQIKSAETRALCEVQLLNMSAIASLDLGQFEDARRTLQDVLVRAEALGSAIDQINASRMLADIAAQFGRWAEAEQLAQRSLAQAVACGAKMQVAWAQKALGRTAQALGRDASAMGLHEQSLTIFRAIGDRREEARALQELGRLRLAQGDAPAALVLCAQARELAQSLQEVPTSCEAMALEARCEVHLARPAAARSRLAAVLAWLAGEGAHRPAHMTIDLRWSCLQVLDPLGDARAAPMLEQLHADVQAYAARITDAADRERLIQAIPTFRDIAAASSRRVEPGAEA